MLSWIATIVGILALIVLHRFFRKTYKAAIWVSLSIGGILLILGGLIMMDAFNFKKGFAESESIFVLLDGEKYIAGIVLNFNPESAEEGVSTYSQLVF